MEPAEEDADDAGELVNLGLLEWRFFDGLDPSEARTLITEVRAVYEDACCEPDEAVQAKGDAMSEEWKPLLDHRPDVDPRSGLPGCRRPQGRQDQQAAGAQAAAPTRTA
jgi:hypothetical protein